MPKRAAAAVFTLIAATMFAAGCSKNRAPAGVARESDFARTYAELMLLQEQEKMTLHVSDSLYRKHADSLLASRGTTREDVKKRSGELMKDDETWRAFLADVSVVFDSLKTARLQMPKR